MPKFYLSRLQVYFMYYLDIILELNVELSIELSVGKFLLTTFYKIKHPYFYK